MTFFTKTHLNALIALVVTLGIQVPENALAQPKHALDDSLAPIYIESAKESLYNKGYIIKNTGTDKDFETAVKVFQKDADLPVTGILDMDTVNMLEFSSVTSQKNPKSTKENQETLSPKAKPQKDKYVEWAQTNLNTLGLYSGPIDGLNGPKTKEALTRYQAKNDLPLTNGTVTPDVLKSLEKSIGTVQEPSKTSSENQKTDPKKEQSIIPPEASKDSLKNSGENSETPHLMPK